MENQLNIDTKNLTKSEHILWDYLKNHLNESIYMTISEIANACNVSESTITRFVKKLGFESFNDFKITLIQVYQSNSFNNSNYNLDFSDLNNPWLSDSERLAQLLYEDINNALLQAITNLNFNDFEVVAKKVQEQENIVICGFASSGVIAQEFFYRLTRVGIHSSFVDDAHTLSFLTANLTENDLIIFISHTGDNKEQIKAAKLMKERNVPVASITANIMSPLALASDLVLMYSGIDKVINFYDIPPYISIVQLYIIDLLSIYISSLDKDKSNTHNHQTIKALENITQ